ncbi:MAG: hypothetical protein M1832_006451 [Thelocarpon impressellum]|nr:MAG: hypothetical protein M1832_006451 [Thelocarpon impressellum]
MVRLVSAAFVASLAASALAATGSSKDAVKCGAGSKCPDNLPCCSQYGECGVGAYCLGGCDPLNSKSLDSCVPEPKCKSKDFKFDSTDGITPKTKYLGDASKTDWVSDGTPTQYQDSVLLTMAQETVGTLLASSVYVWYGKVSATLKTSRGKGVVTAFILLSDVKDEIDYEFVGADLETAQTNYYFQGITNYNNGDNITLSNTFENYHTYTIDWKPDQITWSIDGQVGRTLKKSDTYNQTSKRYDYPQTPSRVQLSLWPAGLSSNGKGTVDWAGGLIDWQSQDIQNNKYYYAAVKDVSIQCYDPPSNAKKTGDKSYIFTDSVGDESAVEISGKETVLKSLLGTGTNMSAGDPAKASKSDAPESSEPASIPGLSGGGTGGSAASHGTDQGAVSGSEGSSNTPQGEVSSASSIAQSTATGFVQAPAAPGTGNSAPAHGERVLQGSLFAGLVAVVGVLLL